MQYNDIQPPIFSVGEALSFDTAAGVSQGYCTPRANEAFDMDLL